MGNSQYSHFSQSKNSLMIGIDRADPLEVWTRSLPYYRWKIPILFALLHTAELVACICILTITINPLPVTYTPHQGTAGVNTGQTLGLSTSDLLPMNYYYY